MGKWYGIVFAYAGWVGQRKINIQNVYWGRLENWIWRNHSWWYWRVESYTQRQALFCEGAVLGRNEESQKRYGLI